MWRRVAVLVCGLAAFVFADTLTLRDGRTVRGTFAGGDTRTVKMLVGDGVQTFRVGEVVSLTFDNDAAYQSTNYPPPQQPAPGPPSQAPGPLQVQGPPPGPAPAAAPPPGPETMAPTTPPPDNSALQTQRPCDQPTPAAPGLTIPAGTQLVVRMIDRVDSDVDRTGQTFRASVDEPVAINGQTVIPRGADANVKLVASTQSGKFAGKTSLTLALQQVLIDGHMVDTYTESVTKASASRGARTGEAVGGGAALGAIIGALAGGGRGAAIGAASGGAIGAGAEAVTAGQRVKVPAETRLTFTLQTDVRI